MAKNRVVGAALAAMSMVSATTLATTPIGATDVGDLVEANAAAKPVIYLSFDDGPSNDNGTMALLDLLEDHGAQATFFVNGSNIDTAGEQAALKRVLTDGHALGSHAYQHLELNSLSDAELSFQLSENHRLVKAITGYDMVCFRSPWGSTFTKAREIAAIEAFPYQLENRWAIDASDYNVAPGLDPVGQAAAVSRSIADALARARDGDTILMHDGTGGKQSTVDGVALFLSEHGDEYELRAIPGCGGADVSTPTTTPTTAPITTTPPPAGPTFDGPIASASSISDILAASDYLPADANYLRLYHALLARNPDVAGAKYWLSLAKQGSSLDDVAWSFSQSTEFTKKYGALDDAAFVTTVYSNVLGRTPDAAGYQYWLGKVQSGELTRHGVVRWIAENAEFQTAHPYRAS